MVKTTASYYAHISTDTGSPDRHFVVFVNPSLKQARTISSVI